MRKSLANLYIPQFRRTLIETEIDHVMKRLDVNGDGVLSAREFKQWLFPHSEQADRQQLANVLKDLIDQRCEGDVHLFFERLKR